MSNTPWDLPKEDLDATVQAAENDLRHWHGARILVTGGTGFLGSWIVGTLIWANRRLSLGLDLVLTTRNPKGVPLEQGKDAILVEADVRALPPIGHVDLVIHGAASSSVSYGSGDGEPRAMASTIFEGTRSVLELAGKSNCRVVFLSSGAVYGPQLAPVSEEVIAGPDPLDPRSAYGEAKRLAETLCAAATSAGEVEAMSARLFAFVGPGLPIDRHYAAGNFLGDILKQQTIRIQGDGRPLRSYLYAADLPQWCMAIASRGLPGRAYNVGSPEALSIAELAEHARRLVDPPVGVEIPGAKTDGPAPCYVPITDRAAGELGLSPRTMLDSALERTLRWCRTR